MFEEGGAESERALSKEAHGIGIANIVGEAVVVGEDDGGAVSAEVGLVAGGMRAAHKNHLAALILVIVRDRNGVFSFRIGDGFFAELQHPFGSVSAFKSHYCTCFI